MIFFVFFDCSAVGACDAIAIASLETRREACTRDSPERSPERSPQRVNESAFQATLDAGSFLDFKVILDRSGLLHTAVRQRDFAVEHTFSAELPANLSSEPPANFAR